jgi:enoyl-[acyl-carrier-protein] reductase (NADH)
MIDPDARERQALQTAVKFMGELMAEIGWATRFNELSAEQAQALAEAAIDGFQEAMAASTPKVDMEIPF